MSYDISLRTKVDADTTWNYCPMFQAAFGHDIKEFSGEPAAIVGANVASALERMRTDPPRFKAFDAPNGWGTYDQLLPQLEAFVRACAEYPNAIVDVT